MKQLSWLTLLLSTLFLASCATPTPPPTPVDPVPPVTTPGPTCDCGHQKCMMKHHSNHATCKKHCAKTACKHECCKGK